MGTEFQFYKMKGIAGVDGGDGCPTMGTYSMPLNLTLHNEWLRL